eukprot:gene7185-1283_t
MPSSVSSGGTAHMLPAERARATFDSATLAEVLHPGGRRALVDKFKPLFSGPEFDASRDQFLSYPDFVAKQIERAAAAMRVVRANPKLMLAHQGQKVQMQELFNTGSLGIHFIAFLPFLVTQATEEQKKEWLQGAMNFTSAPCPAPQPAVVMQHSAEMYIGAYAQTELGHGSNVRALETLATYDKAT